MQAKVRRRAGPLSQAGKFLLLSRNAAGCRDRNCHNGGLLRARTAGRRQCCRPGVRMSFDPANAAGSSAHAGTTYFFCSKGCLAKFEGDPAKYLTAKTPTPNPGKTGPAIEYICPMDPEVSQMGPGSCPRCGMALEPAVHTAPAARTEYTCPMHPEIVRLRAGQLPDLRHGIGTA